MQLSHTLVLPMPLAQIMPVPVTTTRRVAVITICLPGWQSTHHIPGCQRALKNESLKIRWHYIRLLGFLFPGHDSAHSQDRSPDQESHSSLWAELRSL